MAGQKAALMRAAWRRGLGPTLRQGWRTAWDSFVARRHMLYRLTREEILALPEANPFEGVAFREVRDWSDLTPHEAARLEGDYFDWGKRDWLAEGYRLWVGSENGRLASVGWWRGPEAEYFLPLAPDEELLWQTAVPPEFRGRRLLDAALVSVMQMRAREGVAAFHGSCRAFNSTSRTMYARLGWTWLGHADVPIRGPGAGVARVRRAEPPIPARRLETRG